MSGFASGLRAGIDEAARKAAEAQLTDDDVGEACATIATPPPGCGAPAGRPAGEHMEGVG